MSPPYPYKRDGMSKDVNPVKNAKGRSLWSSTRLEDLSRCCSRCLL